MAVRLFQQRLSKDRLDNNLDFREVETFLNSNPEFLKTFMAKNEASKQNPQGQNMSIPPTLSMSKCVEKLVNHERIKKKKFIDDTMDENERFSEFVKDIAGELNVNALSHKILQNVICLTGCDRGRLFLVDRNNERYLISTLSDVTATSALDETMHDENDTIRIPFGKGIIGMVAESKVPMNIQDTSNDPRYNFEIDTLAGYETHCMLCMPIMNKDGDVVGVAEILNKQGVDYFTGKDELLFSEYLNFCGIGINNARLFQMSIEEIQRNQLLLSLAWKISTGKFQIDHIMQVILEYAMKIIKCKCTSVYLIGKNGKSFEKIYRLNNPESTANITNETTEKNVYTKIAKECMENGERLYFKDLSEDPELTACADISLKMDECDNEDIMKFYEEGANWLLCTTIHDQFNERVGCIMFAGMMNTMIRESDTNTIEAFAVYCGLGIYNCQLYERTVRSLKSKTILMEILSYQLTSEKEDVDRLVHIDMPSANECKIYDFGFNDTVLSDESTAQACALMFVKMDALDILDISLEQLYRWILTVKKNYKPRLYHNWRHALNVTQTMFCALNKGVLMKNFSPFECICLLIACLCHDLDYEGYICKDLETSLASVYSTCSSEHQLLGRCVMILNADATNIFRNLKSKRYKEGMELIKKAIFATDMYVYLVNEKSFEELKKKKIPLQNEIDKDMLTSLAMVTCDLYAFSKPWNNHKLVVLAASLDLFQQPISGREAPVLEKSESSKIPSLIIEFFDVICLKVFQTMSEFDESFIELYNACKNNRKYWESIVQRIDDFDFESELNKSRAGLVDFDEPGPTKTKKGNKMEEEKVRKKKREDEARKEKEKEEKERKYHEERERMEKEEKEK